MAQKKKGEALPCTINPKLFQAWQKLMRKKDAPAIAARFGRSRPPVDNALNHGHVVDNTLVDDINTFFTERLDGEEKMGDILLTLHEQADAIKSEA